MAVPAISSSSFGNIKRKIAQYRATTGHDPSAEVIRGLVEADLQGQMALATSQEELNLRNKQLETQATQFSSSQAQQKEEWAAEQERLTKAAEISQQNFLTEQQRLREAEIAARAANSASQDKALGAAAAEGEKNRALNAEQFGATNNLAKQQLEATSTASTVAGVTNLAMMGLTGYSLLKDTALGGKIGDVLNSGFNGIKQIGDKVFNFANGDVSETVAPTAGTPYWSENNLLMNEDKVYTGQVTLSDGSSIYSKKGLLYNNRFQAESPLNWSSPAADYGTKELLTGDVGDQLIAGTDYFGGSTAATTGAESTFWNAGGTLGKGTVGGAFGYGSLGSMAGGIIGPIIGTNEDIGQGIGGAAAGAYYGFAAGGGPIGAVVGGIIGLGSSFIDDVSIICSELNKQGLLSNELLRLDELYRKLYIEDNVYNGYLVLAKPVVRLMKRSKLFTLVIKPFVTCWAEEMASKIDNKRYKENIIGKVLSFIGQPVCRLVNKLTVELDGCHNYRF
jgi:hypothetical protein